MAAESKNPFNKVKTMHINKTKVDESLPARGVFAALSSQHRESGTEETTNSSRKLEANEDERDKYE